MLFNYIDANFDELLEHSPSFRTLCLPGMTESFKLHVFFFIDEETNLRYVFVCEDNSEALQDELHGCVVKMMEDFGKKKVPQAIDVSESDMFSRLSKEYCYNNCDRLERC